MDKQIEELEKDIAVRMAMAKGIAGSMNNGVEGWVSKYLIEMGWTKILENVVVLTREEYDELTLTKQSIFDMLEERDNKVRKETAEKFVERLKEVEEALLDMVVQFCQMVYEGELRHTFMSAEEQAFDVLDIDYGEKVDDVYERFNKKWNRPIDEICKEITEGT